MPTLYIKNLDNLPATGRSNKIITFLSLQDYSQLVRDYGDKNAKTIIANLGNQFTGMTNNETTAKRISDMLGKIKKVDFSYSKSSSSRNTSEKLQSENVREIRDIMGQEIGHFTGKIAGGSPAFFSAQFENFEEIYQKKHGNFIDIPKKDIGIEDIELEKIYYTQLMEERFDQVNTNIKEILEPYSKLIRQNRENV